MAAKRKPTRKKPPQKAAGRRPVRKSASRSRARRKKRKSTGTVSLLMKPLLGLSILALMVMVAVLAADFFLAPSHPTRSKSEQTTNPAGRSERQSPEIAAVPPKYEVFPPIEKAPPEPAPRPMPPIEPSPVTGRPKVAIIIDDLGYDHKIAAKFISLDAALTFAVLPHSPFQKKIANLAHAEGKQTMLHLPMEPDKYPSVNPGPGTLLSTMPPDELIAQLEDNLDAIPHIKGVNNHMGSKFTTASDQMNQVFSVLKQRGLFFVDSRTTSSTVCRPSAKLFQLPFAQRDVFIDHFQKADFIRKQLKKLVRIARRNGYAVGIAHPHTVTYRILKEMLPEIQNQVQVVPASEIVSKVG